MPPKGHLPFDLHVLGLPLAFILSQDQTLLCKFDISFLFYSVLSDLSARIDKVFIFLYSCTLTFQTLLGSFVQRTSLNNLSLYLHRRSRCFASAKILLFPFPPTLF